MGTRTRTRLADPTPAPTADGGPVNTGTSEQPAEAAMNISTTRQTAHATRFRFTPGAVERLRLADGERQAVFRDKEIKGFGVIVGRAGKSWFVERRIGAAGAPVKRTIDTTDKMSLAEARKIAQKWLPAMRDGIDPHQQRRDADAKRKAEAAERERRAVTLRHVLEDYCKRPDLEAVSKKNMNGDVDRYLSDWADRPIHEITKDAVIDRFRSIEREVAAKEIKLAKQNKRPPRANWDGKTAANNTMRTLGTLFAHAIN